MTILVVGCRGMLARDLVPRLGGDGHRTVCFDLPELDITRFTQTRATLTDVRPNLVINCAAYTAVDKAESESDLAFAVNRDGAGNLTNVCGELGIPLIHLSTDYVFDGEARRPYREDDPAKPLSVYGRSKLEGERAVRQGLQEHLIVRSSWLFGGGGTNFVKTILRLSREREELRVVSDQRGCPTWTWDLAEALNVLAKAIKEDRTEVPWGTYHYCGAGPATWHELAEAIIRGGGRREPLLAERVVPISTEEYGAPAPRPKWSVLDCSKIQRAFGAEVRPWQVGLEAVLDELCAAGKGQD